MDTAAAAKSILGEVVAWRRKLHQIPEIGLELHQTAGYVRECLDQMDISHHTAAQTGVVALIESGKPGPTLVLRADMDALPIVEDTGLAFAATNGNMHACGHDAHTAMLLGAARILVAERSRFIGNIKLLFQPGEEGHGGAAKMIADGCLDNPAVDAAVGLHVGQIFPEVGTGQIGVCDGPILAASSPFTITVQGKSAHGAMPHQGVDAITVSAEIILALQKIISREINPLDQAVLTIGKINGGEAFNIVTEKVTMNGDFRTLTKENRQFITRRMEELCSAVAGAHRASATVDFLEGFPPTVNDPRFTEMLIGSAKKVIDPADIIEIRKPNMGTEDMSLYLEKVPGTFFIIGTGNPEKNIIYPHHNPRFDVDEDTFWIGPAIFAQFALDFLCPQKE